MEKPYAIIDKSTDKVVNIIISTSDYIHIALDENQYSVECTPLAKIGIQYDKDKGYFPEVYEQEQILELNKEIDDKLKEIDFIYNQKTPPISLTEEEINPFYEYYGSLSSLLSHELDLSTKAERFNSLVEKKPDYSIIINAYEKDKEPKEETTSEQDNKK